eukprot:s2738_g3.t3
MEQYLLSEPGLRRQDLDTGTSASLPRTANALETLNSEMLVEPLPSMQSLTQSVASDAKRDKVTKALITAQLMVKDLELVRKERAVEEQRAWQLRGQLATVEKLLGLSGLAAWRLVPGDVKGFTIDADRIANRQADLQQRDKSWVSTARLLAGCPKDQVEADIWHKVNDFLDGFGYETAESTDFEQFFRISAESKTLKVRVARVRYIMELIEIEEKARRLVVQAIERERHLHLIEDRNIQNVFQQAEFREELRRFVGCIAHLNSVANVRRKGRDDLGMEVLLDAMQTLCRCDDQEKGGENSEKLAAARILAKDVLDSFTAMREYLREVGRCLERVDPHLCNNAGLVARLVDWEESWEVGTRYVQQEKMLTAVCDLVAEVRSAQRIVPALAQMCEECDVEMFMVMPRLAWLRFLDKPTQLQGLFKSLLPHRFEVNPDTEKLADAELANLMRKFDETKELLMSTMSPKQGGQLQSSQEATWKMLVKRVVNGASSEDTYKWIEPSLREPAEKAVEDLMRDLEAWSMELARHCPEDWNQCCGILVQCLSGSEKESTKAPFRV